MATALIPQFVAIDLASAMQDNMYELIEIAKRNNLFTTYKKGWTGVNGQEIHYITEIKMWVPVEYLSFFKYYNPN